MRANTGSKRLTHAAGRGDRRPRVCRGDRGRRSAFWFQGVGLDSHFARRASCFFTKLKFYASHLISATNRSIQDFNVEFLSKLGYGFETGPDGKSI